VEKKTVGTAIANLPPLADRLYDEYIAEIRKEGLLDG
jgi:hypothetical protein